MDSRFCPPTRTLDKWWECGRCHTICDNSERYCATCEQCLDMYTFKAGIQMFERNSDFQNFVLNKSTETEDVVRKIEIYYLLFILIQLLQVYLISFLKTYENEYSIKSYGATRGEISQNYWLSFSIGILVGIILVVVTVVLFPVDINYDNCITEFKKLSLVVSYLYHQYESYCHRAWSFYFEALITLN